MSQTRTKLLISLGVGLLLLATSCSVSNKIESDDAYVEASRDCATGTPVEANQKLKVAATVAPITSLVASIVGDKADLNGLVPEGNNSHTYEPPPSIAKTLSQTDVLFTNGLDLEIPIEQLAKTNLRKSATLCELGTSNIHEQDYIFDFSFPRESGKPNPHLWTDPTYAMKYVEKARDVLVQVDPHNSSTYTANALKVLGDLSHLDAAIKAATDTLQADSRKLLTYHDAYAYFARTYDWKVVGAIQPSNFSEPTTKEISKLIRQIRDEKVKAIFGSEVFPSSVLEKIGKESGAKYVDVLRDDDLLGKPSETNHNYIELMKFNYKTMVTALGGDANPLNYLYVDSTSSDDVSYLQ